MKYILFVFTVLVVVCFPSLLNAGGHGPHWSYSGDTGPGHWGDLDPSYASCKEGKAQSPINLKWSKVKDKSEIKLSYHDSSIKMLDNGHTIQTNFEPGNKAWIHGQEYELLQMHFHTGSEHQFSGKGFPLELHFVHKDPHGKLAVIGVMFKEGEENPLINDLWKNIPHEKNEEVAVSGTKLNPEKLIPEVQTHYHYQGSLTTPPCSEGVSWNVLNTPLEVSKSQIDAFKKLYSKNNRPVQALNGRKPANY